MAQITCIGIGGLHEAFPLCKDMSQGAICFTIFNLNSLQIHLNYMSELNKVTNHVKSISKFSSVTTMMPSLLR